MNRRNWIAVAVVTLLALAGGYGLRCWQAPRSSAASVLGPPFPGGPASGSTTADLPPQFKRGRELAQVVCAGCHVFPEPALLPKRIWAHHVLPQVAVRLGVEPVNYEGMQEGKILQEANLYPTEPAISEADWFAIWDYYVASAPNQPLPPAPKPKLTVGLKNFRAKKLNFHGGMPMTSLVKIDPSRKLLYVGDGYAGMLAAVGPAGNVINRVKLASAPVGLALKDAGAYATLIGRYFPSDVLEGSLVFVPNNPRQPPQPVLEQLRRPVDAAVADLNQDGRDDLVVCSFGNRLGRFSWFEARERGGFEEHVLLERPGAEHVELSDFNKDGRLDIMVLMGQAREGVYIFYNEGQGLFRMETVFELPPPYGSVYFELVDFNRDGQVDLLTATGDNGDNPAPHKNYHGLRLYLNDGKNHFTEAWFYPMEGAYKVRAFDFDGDGDLDLAAIAYFPDFERGLMEGFVYFENQGNLRFVPLSIPESADGRWIAMDAGDLDGDGDADIVLGSFIVGPTTIAVPPAVHENWKTNGAAVLLLENLRR